MEFYSLDNILKNNAHYNIIIGERSNGKTYACLKYGLEKINLYYQASNRFIEDRDYWYNLANREYNKVLGIYLKLRAWDKVELAKKLFPELSEENKYTDDIATNLLIKKSNHYKNLFNIFLPISIFLLLANILLIYLVFAHSKFN